MIRKIVAGGQTGADRAALDFALARAIPHGGWCPRGRWAEDGIIPAVYQLKQTPSPDPSQRTEWNVRDSHATVIFSVAAGLTGGSEQTAEFARRHRKPWLHLSRHRLGAAGSAAELSSFLRQHGIGVLNVAGPRRSEEPAVSGFVRQVLEKLPEELWRRGN